MNLARYQRQMLLSQLGEKGQEALAKSHVLVVGCGALGCASAEQLARAGVGRLTVVDRDVVELTNLQRQTLYEEADVAAELPKAVAAAKRLAAVNSGISITPVVTDVHAGNIESLARGVDLIVDGTDNVATRYLLNDAAVKLNIPWIYGGAVGVDGRVMAVKPGATPCLRCVFRDPPAAHDLPTCDTAGVLGMATTIVGARQAILALQILTGQFEHASLEHFSFWEPRWHVVDLADQRAVDCVCCGQRKFEFLDAVGGESAVTLCGRNAVQVRPGKGVRIDLGELASRLASAGRVERTPHLLKCHLTEPAGVCMTVFADGRAMLQGVTDLGRAKAIYARFVGA